MRGFEGVGVDQDSGSASQTASCFLAGEPHLGWAGFLGEFFGGHVVGLTPSTPPPPPSWAMWHCFGRQNVVRSDMEHFWAESLGPWQDLWGPPPCRILEARAAGQLSAGFKGPQRAELPVNSQEQAEAFVMLVH